MIWSRFFHILTFGICGAVLLASVSLGVGRHTLSLSARTSETVYLYIEPGDGLKGIAHKARKLGLVVRPWHFVAGARLLAKETTLQAGEYAIEPHAKLQDIIEKIAAGDVYYRKLAVPEGLSVAQVEALLFEASGLDWEGYSSPEEGSLLPETYFYTRGEKASSLVARMQKNMQSALDKLWQERAPDLPILNKAEALVLASIVEKETGVPAERGLVAAVFTNRLKRHMRLQSDPTVVYGITMGQPLGRRLTSGDLKEETAFNTYRIHGLPPTPISNPGLDSVAAVLTPSDADYLYFVADGNGGHAFAKTLREHNRNVARWRRIRDAEK